MNAMVQARSRAVARPKVSAPARPIPTSYLLVAMVFVLASALALGLNIPLSAILDAYSYDVLIILVVMELFTNLICQTGIMGLLAMRFVLLSRGHRQAAMLLFGAMMFFISSTLNNITAILIVVLLLKPTGILGKKITEKFYGFRPGITSLSAFRNIFQKPVSLLDHQDM